MVRARLDRGSAAAAWLRVAVVSCGLAAVGGCTICPDPFDYSGPVPNGSTPQNDFRARSNGILPLGMAPRPWPTVVQDEPRPEALDLTPEAEAEPVAVEPADPIEAFVVRQTVASLPESEAAPVADAPSDAPAAPAVLPAWPQDETPGWRARR
jgi:hypothetical protein